MDQFTFPLIALPPILSLSLDGETGTEGSAITGTVVSLQGLATLADVVDSAVTVSLTWSRSDPNELLNVTALTSPPYTVATTIDPISVGGVFEFMVTVTPSNSRFVRGITVNTSYTINLEPYPSLMIRETVRSGECVVNETATLIGNVRLLPNTATNHIITYSWTGPDRQAIPASSEDFTVMGETLVINNPRNNAGSYILIGCLTIPGTDVMNRCIPADYPISTDG